MQIIRATKRLARSLGAEWLAVAVDTGIEGRHSADIKEATARNLRLAEELGAETQMLVGLNVADVLIDFARSRNVTKIVAGKTAQPRWKQWFVSTVVEQLLNKSGDIDVCVVSGEGEVPIREHRVSSPTAIRWSDYLKAAAVVAFCGCLRLRLAHVAGLADANVVMIFLAGVAICFRPLGARPFDSLRDCQRAGV